MRSLPIIVDLFVLLTVFALVLFNAAIGRSAPEPSATTLVYVEARAVVSTTTRDDPATSVFEFVPQLVDINDKPLQGVIVEEETQDDRTLVFVVRSAPPSAQLRLLVSRMDYSAYDYETIELQIERMYPGREISRDTKPIGQAPIVQVSVSEE